MNEGTMNNSNIQRHHLDQKASALRDEIGRVIAHAKAEHRTALTEIEGMSILAAMGIHTPQYWLVQGMDDF